MSSFLNKCNLDKDNLLILLGSGISFLVIFSFSIYRFFIGDIKLASVDLAVSAVALVLFVQTWRSKNIENIKMLLVLMYMGAMFTVLYLRGSELLLWTFPALSATFFLLPVRLSLPMNVVFVLATIPIVVSKMSMSHLLSFYATLTLVCIFGYIFSARAESQQQKLFQLATMDSLTRVENRHSMDNRLNELVSIKAQNPLPSSILVLDLDFFKLVNDTYGHVMGDKILMHFADIVKSTVRVSDCLYRFGGEEFVVVANNSSLENAGRLAEKLRKTVEYDSMLKKYSVTVSIGVAELSESDDKDDLLKRADKALYKAKDLSRNLVCLAHPLADQRGHKYVPYTKDFKNLTIERKKEDPVVAVRTFRNGMI